MADIITPDDEPAEPTPSATPAPDDAAKAELALAVQTLPPEERARLEAEAAKITPRISRVKGSINRISNICLPGGVMMATLGTLGIGICGGPAAACATFLGGGALMIASGVGLGITNFQRSNLEIKKSEILAPVHEEDNRLRREQEEKCERRLKNVVQSAFDETIKDVTLRQGDVVLLDNPNKEGEKLALRVTDIFEFRAQPGAPRQQQIMAKLYRHVPTEPTNFERYREISGFDKLTATRPAPSELDLLYAKSAQHQQAQNPPAP